MTLSRRDLILSASSAFVASAFPASAAPAGDALPRVLRGPAFGSSWTLAAGEPVDEPAVVVALEGVVASVDAAMSPFRPDSEIARFNRSPSTDWQPLSATTCAVVGEGLRVAGMTANAFDPTVGPLVGRYGFGPIGKGVAGAPGEIGLGEAMARKARAGLSLDLCGIAKGHALDRMAAACAAQGLTDFLLELGGEVFAAGRHPSGRRWQVGVEGPQGGFQRVVAPDDKALATSGNAVNAYAHGGLRYSHIIDPFTGRPADTVLASVTVAAETAMTSDALATALYAMGPERGPAFAESAGIEALFVMDDAREVATGGFEARILV